MAQKSLPTSITEGQAITRIGNPRKISPVSDNKNVAATGTAERLLPLAISGVDQGTKTFTIAGDYTDYISENDIITVEDSTGNDDDFTVVSATENAGSTDIVTSEAIPDPTVDGNIILDIPCRKIRVQALDTNTGKVAIGGSNIAIGKGEELTAGEESTISTDITSRLDLNEHFIDVEVNGEGVTFNFYRYKWS